MSSNPAGDPALPLPGLRSLAAPLIEAAPLPMVEVEGPDYRVCFVNSAFCRLVGGARQDLLGKAFAEIVTNGAGCLPILDRVYKTGGSETQVIPDAANPDAVCWLLAMWPALDTEGPGRVIIQLTKAAAPGRRDIVAINEALLLGSLRQHELQALSDEANARLQIEITERKRAEHSLLEAQAELRAKADSLEQTVAARTAELRASIGHLEAFSYSLVHDLRAPVRAIQGFTQMALEMPRAEVGPAAVELLQRVINASTRMDRLIQDVLSLSQVISQPMQITTVNVDALVRDLVLERPELAPPRADVQIIDRLLAMRGHEATLGQCLANLLDNAVKFVVPGEVPLVRVWTEELTIPTPPASGENPAAPSPIPRTVVRLWVEDQGIGIDPRNRTKIFEIFQRLHDTSHYEGTGIGLAIVSRAAARMQGRVGVQAGRPKGSRFWLELPAS